MDGFGQAIHRQLVTLAGRQNPRPDHTCRPFPQGGQLMTDASRQTKKIKVLALSSGGGHWVQLLRLRPAFTNCDVVFATVKEGYRSDVGNAKFRVIPDANRWNKVGLVRVLLAIFRLLWLER